MMRPQSPGTGQEAVPSPLESPPTLSSFTDVKMMWLSAVPSASRMPLTTRFLPGPSFTTAPGSMVSCTPGLTVTSPTTMYGLSASAQVVLAVIAPLTPVGLGGVGSSGRGGGVGTGAVVNQGA